MHEAANSGAVSGARASPPRRSILRLARPASLAGADPRTQCGAGWRPSTRDGWVARKWNGYPDFLVRVPGRRAPSGTGPTRWWTPSSRACGESGRGTPDRHVFATPGTELQGKRRRRRMHLVLGGGQELETLSRRGVRGFRTRASGERFEEHCADATGQRIRSRSGSAPGAIGTTSCRDTAAGGRSPFPGGQRDAAPAPRVWKQRGDHHPRRGWRASRLPMDPPARGGATLLRYDRIHRQAKAQLTGRERGLPFHELIRPPEDGRGLLALPEPSEGDLFFDIESSRPTADGGLEYLFGFVDRDGALRGPAGLSTAKGNERRVFENVHRRGGGAAGSVSPTCTSTTTGATKPAR